MKIAGRDVRWLAQTACHRNTWAAVSNMLTHVEHPIGTLYEYAFRRGRYPRAFTVRVPGRTLEIVAYSHADLLTISEVFFRHDYPLVPGDRTIVDIGANIGISALYFLTNASSSFVYCYEPLPENCRRLAKTLTGFAGRYVLHEEAVAETAGKREFTFEATGRYGGLRGLGGFDNVPSGTMTVPVTASGEIIESILRMHAEIDLVKVDTEGTEAEIIHGIDRAQLRRIRRLHVEERFDHNPLGYTHDMRRYGYVTHFDRR